MRFVVLALGAICIAQPAFARSPAHKHVHHAARHHAGVHHVARHHLRHHRGHYVMRRQGEEIESGYAMPQAFARTDAWQQQGVWQQQHDTWRSQQGSWRQRQNGWQQNAWQQNASQQNAWQQDGWQRNDWQQNTWAQNSWDQSSAPQSGYEPRGRRASAVRNSALDGAIARHAAANGLPVELVHRVVRRESNYNPRASSKGNFGLMQIRYQTARGVGYSGSPSGLLDAETNLTYAVRYLKGAYQAAGGNQSRAVALYASGYHGRGVRVARATPVRGPQQPAWDGGWGTQPSPDWQGAQVAMRNDMVEAAPPYRVRHYRRAR